MRPSTQEFPPPTDLHPEIPHSARIDNYLLGGKDHFPADREAAERLIAIHPGTPAAAQAHRAFLERAVRYVAAEGVTRFLDIGPGIPTGAATHEIAQQVDTGARVVYVDSDPIVMAHVRALRSGAGHGATYAVRGDLRDPKQLLTDPLIRQALDFDRPVAVLLAGVLQFVDDDQDPYGIVRTLLDALAPGSYLVLSHATDDFDPPARARRGRTVYGRTGSSLTPRTQAEVLRFFDGLELLRPGLVIPPEWRDQEPGSVGWSPDYAGVARKL
ncbi:SAM-dependent methyltransferase [Streptacidiphilus sp. EB129]|uniref:SAM-dependent methyltransferase n=1 Tax=Streptacidiphilus sp. EB129 TaxID=3156262 RepID=UPI0035144AA8